MGILSRFFGRSNPTTTIEGLHAYVTPRALSTIRQHEAANVRPGERYCIALHHAGDETRLAVYILPYPKLEQTLVRLACEQVPVFIDRSLQGLFATVVIDWAPNTEEDPFMEGFDWATITRPPGSASNPGGLRLSLERLQEMDPALFSGPADNAALGEVGKLANRLWLGDACGAIVVAVAPQLVVAAYSGDLDCVALVSAPEGVVLRPAWRVGTRLVTVNSYTRENAVAPDLVAGPAATGVWTNFTPTIGHWLSDDHARLERLVSGSIAEAEWGRVTQLAQEAMARSPRRIRSGHWMQAGSRGGK
jgi:hypothetical protein